MMKIPTSIKNLSLKKIALWVVGIVAAIGVLGFFAVPPAIKAIADKVVWDKFHRKVALEDIGFNPYDMTLNVKGFSLTERDGSTRAAGVGSLHLNLDIMSLFRWGVVVHELKVERPYFRLVRNADKSLNIDDILAEVLKPSEKPPTRFAISNIQVAGGEIVLEDRLKQATHTVKNLAFGLPFVSNLPDDAEIFVTPHFSAVVDGQGLKLDGRTRPFKKSRESQLDIRLADVNIPRYLEYLPQELPVRIPSARLDADLALVFAMAEGKPNTIRLRGTTALRELSVQDREGAPLLALTRLGVKLANLDVIARDAHVAEVTIDGPEITASRSRDGSVNFQRLAPPAPATDAKPAAGTPFRYRVDAITLANGRLHFSDAVPAHAFQAEVKDIAVRVSNLSNAAGKAATVEASLATEAGESVKHNGTLTLAPLSAEGRIEAADLPVKRYAPYYEHAAPIEVIDGVAGLAARYRFAKTEGGLDTAVSELSVGLKNFAVRARDGKAPFFKLASLAIEGGEADAGKHEASVADIRVSGGQLIAVRGNDRRIDLAALAPKPAAAQAKGEPAAPWKISMKKLSVEKFGTRFEDRALPQPVTHTADIDSLVLSNYSNARGNKTAFNLRASFNKTGKVTAKGSAGVDPLTAYGQLDAKGLDLVPLQPYFTDKVNVTLTRGEFAAKGTVTAAQNPDKSLKIGYTGEATVGKFHLVDNLVTEDLLKWDSLHFAGVVASTSPMSLDIEQIALTDFYARAIVSREGKLNLGSVARKPEPAAVEGEKTDQATPAMEGTPTAPAEPEAPVAAAATTTPPAAAAPESGKIPVRVGAVTLQAGQVNFTDNFIQPNYTANLTRLSGRISGLSSDASVNADVDIIGEFDNAAPLTIKGKVNPLAKNLFLDIEAQVKDFELTPASPYAVKYAGYGINKGKLSLDLKYHVENRKVSAQNRIFLNQLTFGEKVESPTATKLPVLLAVALLKDRAGNIDIDLPISGTLDDPKFSIGGIIVRLIVNLIVKAVLSPFALLGSLFGGSGTELSYAEFDFGRAVITAPVETKLKNLSKALYERPGLKLDIAGRVDSEKDREGLRAWKIEQAIKAAKLKDLVKQGQSVGSVDDVKLEQGEYVKYLTVAYKDAKFPKPRNFIGLLKDLPVPEMEKLMNTHTEVSDDDLRALAAARANAVKEFLLKTGQVTADRVFIVPAKAEKEKDKSKEKVKESRVDFSLK